MKNMTPSWQLTAILEASVAYAELTSRADDQARQYIGMQLANYQPSDPVVTARGQHFVQVIHDLGQFLLDVAEPDPPKSR